MFRQTTLALLASGVLTTGVAFSQTAPNPTQQAITVSQGDVPVFRITVVGRTTPAINYRPRRGDTKIDFAGTALMPQARGSATVSGEQGYIQIEAKFEKIEPAGRFGREYLTYVLWAITPEGRATNLGEIQVDDADAKVKVTTQLQAFGLIVTAEPYFAVTQPSDVVVIENVVREGTNGNVEVIQAKYELLKRGSYLMNQDAARLNIKALDPGSSLDLAQARNAVELARIAGADRFATETFDKAAGLLATAEEAQDAPSRRQRRHDAGAAGGTDRGRRAARRTPEAGRGLPGGTAHPGSGAGARRGRSRAGPDEARRRQAELDTQAAAAARAAAERAASADAAGRAAAERDTATAVAGRLAAERDTATADAARVAAETAQAQAESARRTAEAQIQQAQNAAAQSEKDKDALRAQLREQLNVILETRETSRGLIVNLSDVLFDSASSNLKAGAREKLARCPGILLSHPGLQLAIEGHTDSIGTDAYNQQLSERRAESVRVYFAGQRIGRADVGTAGFGESQPVATNDTAAGRQQNRRVELVVSGDIIGRS